MSRVYVPRSWMLLLTLGCLAVTACRPAAYEIIRGKKSKKNSDGVPHEIAKPTKPGKEPDVKPEVKPTSNLLPTARVEVIVNEQTVTTVQVNQPVSIRPAYDTVDADDVGKSQCVNPGIVSADYSIGSDAKKSAKRTQNCDSLAVPYTFSKAGAYTISMVVVSNENEKALASMQLVVVDQATTAANEGGFKIKANPLLAGKGQAITFTGTCDTATANTITWNFNDGGTATGKTATHSYSKLGQFRVEATCVDAKGITKKAVLTIVVLDKQIGIPGKEPVDGKLPIIVKEPIPVDPDNCQCQCYCYCNCCGCQEYWVRY